MTSIATADRLKNVCAAVVLPAVTVLLFWRAGFFFIQDDWTALAQMAENPLLRFLVLPDGEQWFPLCHLAFYGLIRTFGDRYSFLVLANCIGTGLNAFLFHVLARRHLGFAKALTLSVVYSAAAAHHAIAWNSFYICYVLSLGFLLGALLLTHEYARFPSAGRLAGIGCCALCSVLSHNYTLLALPVIPLYPIIAMPPGVGRAGRRAPAAMMGAVYVLFSVGYLSFAGSMAPASHNQAVFSSIPGPAYLVHWFSGSFLSPFLYLFWGHFHFPVWDYVVSITLFALGVWVILRWGNSAEKRLAAWACLFNSLPMLLVSLTRYTRPSGQAFVARYAVFTLLGALLLLGIAWTIVERKTPSRRWSTLPAVTLAILMIAGQAFSLPRWLDAYTRMSRASLRFYQSLDAGKCSDPGFPDRPFNEFWMDVRIPLTGRQFLEIRRMLEAAAVPPEKDRGAGGTGPEIKRARLLSGPLEVDR
ncbi:hypothetical protein [Syntrophobacter fumaroxidans]|uniref:Glycosyltransferase RgtA/B/C/D-like domain-containing protein n=1 Tax=Syntrophobacter fumaroxidans (strain DSM 10017 / MPOB) TaxID=335543 RepID=A0LKH0_SYNFM|nr:hypothetical protein [Syntrophobacter fumaroxidans]ABK17922.1 hypothetical protein Sfum_2240 [Syntrophobacter fumaroxidans MPOB]